MLSTLVAKELTDAGLGYVAREIGNVVDKGCRDSAWLELWDGTTFERVGYREHVGLSVPRLVIAEIGIRTALPYHDCVAIAERIEAKLKDADKVVLEDGTIFEKSFTPVRKSPAVVSQKPNESLARQILKGPSSKDGYKAYVRYPRDKSAFVTIGTIIGGHYSWNPAGFTVWVDAWERNPEWPPDHILGIRELKRPRTFEATEAGVMKALDYVEREFPTFTESTWVPRSIPVYVAQELGILKLEHLPQTTRKLTSIWFEKGLQAGRGDGWMDVENTIKETAQKHPEIKDVHELVWTDIDLWEETDHFNILYGSKMWQDALAEAHGDREKAIDIYADLKSEFWEGYLAGRKEIGRDVYRIAGELVKLPPTEVVPLARYRGLAVMPRLPEEAKRDILFVEYIRDLVKLGERVTDAEARLMWKAWKKRYPQNQAQTIPKDDYELGYKHGMSICGLYGAKQAKKLARLKPINRYERGKKQACIDYLKQKGIEVPTEARRRKSRAVVPVEPRRPRPGKEGQLEFLPDSPEVLAQTIDAIGYREKIDSAFQEAIKRVKGLSDIYRGFKELQ